MTAIRAIDLASIVKSCLDRGMNGLFESAHLSNARGQTLDLRAIDPQTDEDNVRDQMTGCRFTITIDPAPPGMLAEAPPTRRPHTRKAYKRQERSRDRTSRWETSIREGNHLPIAPYISVN
jgi:hypothetical protein